MKKIISLFQRNYETDKLVRDEVVPGAEWVIAGEGVATRKYDGTSCLIRDGKMYKRYDAKRDKKPPEGWEPCEGAPDPNTGHWPGWVPVGDGPEDWMHRAVFEGTLAMAIENYEPGTYELCGPKVGKNPEHKENYVLLRHGAVIVDAPRAHAALKAWLAENPMEGVVWHHPDGRMVKIKTRDFGLKWPR